MTVQPNIDYVLLAEALTFYTNRGFHYLETPWLVPHEICSVTRPKGREGCKVIPWYEDFVASGEQGFISLFDEIQSGRWATVTPCLRDEPVVDELHHKYFMKLELISINPPDHFSEMAALLNLARNFFEEKGMVCKSVVTADGYDLVSRYEDIEIGSYGMRSYKDTTWVYGTGLALPRFSQALTKQDANTKAG